MNTFRIQGSLHLSCYINSEKTTLKDVLDLLKSDLKSQIRYRIEVLDEEA